MLIAYYRPAGHFQAAFGQTLPKSPGPYQKSIMKINRWQPYPVPSSKVTYPTEKKTHRLPKHLGRVRWSQASEFLVYPDIFGCTTSQCQDMPRTASVRAATPVTALSLTREAGNGEWQNGWHEFLVYLFYFELLVWYELLQFFSGLLGSNWPSIWECLKWIEMTSWFGLVFILKDI